MIRMRPANPRFRREGPQRRCASGCEEAEAIAPIVMALMPYRAVDFAAIQLSAHFGGLPQALLGLSESYQSRIAAHDVGELRGSDHVLQAGETFRCPLRHQIHHALGPASTVSAHDLGGLG